MCSLKLHALAKKSLRLEEWHDKQNTSFLKLEMWAKWRLGHVEWHEKWNTSSLELNRHWYRQNFM